MNVGAQELETERTRVIGDLVAPLASVLDDSIGCALWFAARGRGVLEEQEYTSPVRVSIQSILKIVPFHIDMAAFLPGN